MDDTRDNRENVNSKKERVSFGEDKDEAREREKKIEIERSGSLVSAGKKNIVFFLRSLREETEEV